MNGLLQLSKNDFIKGLVLAIIVAVLTWLMQVVGSDTFQFSSVDWSQIAKVAVTSGIGYILKNLLTTNDGKVLGAIGGK